MTDASSVPLQIRIRSTIAGVVRRRMIRAKDQFLQHARTSCREVQRKTLARLIQLNSDSRFSAAHGLKPEMTLSQFRQRLPVSDYETFRTHVDCMKQGDHRSLLGRHNPLLMYAVTSGTTAESKLIPVTRQFVSDYRRGWQNWGMGVYQNHPALSLRRIVQISSAHDRWRTEDGTPCGNISGLASSMQKKIVQKLYTIPVATAGIVDPDKKRQAVATFALADPWVGMFITANPSTLLQLIDCANESAEDIIRDIHDGTLSGMGASPEPGARLSGRLRPNPTRARELSVIMHTCGQMNPQQIWPRLTCVGVWTGGSAAAYLPQLRQAFGDVPIRDHGLHASEGRMTIPFEDNTPAGLLDIESHYFEFIPYEQADRKNATVLEAHELQAGHDYFILLTTSSGLYRYNIYDVVRCVGHFGTTPLLEFLHKGAHISSITGEKITESQVVDAVSAAAAAEGIALRHFTLTPVWGEPPGYRLYVDAEVEAGCDNDRFARLAAATDRELSRLNCEYADKRLTSRLRPLQCELLSGSVWTQFARNRIAASGGSPEQYKHPCLFPDSRFEGRFLAMME